MKIKRLIAITLFTILITAVFSIPSFAAEEKADPGSAWTIYFRPGVRFGTESRVLYIMDFLVPLYQDEKNIVFGNIKYTPNDHDGWELNAGMGYRRLLWNNDLVLGVNAYYDRRKTDWGTNHEQWGVGLEAMADIPLKSFDLGLTGRFNYYYPLSHTKIYGLGTAYASYVLSDSGIILTGGRVEEPMRGFDYEAGVRIPLISDYVETWAYAGGYHYHGRRVSDINGFMARLEVIPTDFMRLNYEFHYDNYEKGEHYGEVTFEVPFSIGNLVTGKNPFEGIGDVFTGSRELTARMVEPVRRDVDVKVTVDNDNDNIPSGGEEIEDIVFVSETGVDAPGNGTIKNPYATISYALANDARILSGKCKTIHVMNSSTTAVISDSPNINISSFLLWGSGANHPTHPVSNMPYSGHPTIDDTVYMRAPGMTVTGLHFDTTTTNNHGIYINDTAAGAGPIITNNLFDIAIDSDWEAGINCWINTGMGDLGTPSNPAVIANNTINVTDTGSNIGVGIGLAADNIYAEVMNNTITVSSGGSDTYGIRIVQPSALAGAGTLGSTGLPILVSGNDVTISSSGNGQGLVFSNAGDGSSIFTNILGNSLDVTGAIDSYGIHFYDDTNNTIGSESNPVIISGNLMAVESTNNLAYGIYLDADLDIFAAVTGNDMSINGFYDAYGIRLYSNDGGIGSAARPVTVSGNLMNVVSTDEDTFGIRFSSDNSTYLNFTKNVMNLQADERACGLYTYLPGNLFLKFAGNDVTLKSSSTYVQGFYLDIDNGDYGSVNNPIVIKDNRFTLEAAAGTSNVLSMLNDVGPEDVYMRVLDNSIEFTNTGTGNIYAFDFWGGVPGNIGFYPNNPVIISGNAVRFYGGDNRFIDIDKSTPDNYNYLIWGGNSLYNTGTWSGNYGPNNEVWNTFTGTDVIHP